MSDRRRTVAYFVPGALGAHPAGADEARRRAAYLQEHAFAGTTVVLRDNPAGPASIESVEDERRAAASMLDVLPGAVADADAVIIGCFGDPGLARAQALLPVPVVGPAAASIHLAAQLGGRVGLLTVVEEVIPILHQLVATLGMGTRVASVRAVEVPVLELRERREEVIARLLREGRQAKKDGADALILGCMTMGFLDVADDLSAALAIPVLNPVLAALHTAEALLGLSQASETSAS
jgi:allantoin racemase